MIFIVLKPLDKKKKCDSPPMIVSITKELMQQTVI